MSYRYLLGASLALFLAGCQPTSSPPNGLRLVAHDDPPLDAGQASDGGAFAGIDPTVAHFFNTATLANDQAVVVAATQDGGADADAGN